MNNSLIDQGIHHTLDDLFQERFQQSSSQDLFKQTHQQYLQHIQAFQWELTWF